MDPTQEQHQILCESQKKCEGDPSKTRVWERKHEPYMESSKSLRQKISETSEEHAHNFLHITVTYFGSCVKMCEDFIPNFGDKRTHCCIPTMHYFTLPFSQKTTWLSSPTHPTFSVSPIEDKTERPPF
jgi:hypothetical protein